LVRSDGIAERERPFHDAWANSIDPRNVPVQETFTASTSPEAQWLLTQMGELRGRRVLDLGSGAGEAAVYFARLEAEVVATDLSSKMLEVLKKAATLHGTCVKIIVGSAQDLPFASDSFDIVYAANLLHHVDIEQCLDEVRRVLRPGGIGAFWDPLAHNPLINIYRRMARAVRTEDEHPIRRSQLLWFTKRFDEVRTRCFWLLALLVFVKFYLVDRVHPSADRYWKRILTHESEIRWLNRPLAALDTLILRLAPILRWWCWNIAILVKKKA